MGNPLVEYYNNLRHTDLPQWQESMRQAAIHEAGHAPVQILLGHTPEDIVEISIKVNEDGRGRVERDCQCHPFCFPEPLKRYAVLRQICITLAGRVVEDELIDGAEVLDPESEEWEEIGTDLHTAAFSAEEISSRDEPPMQILELVEKLVRELIREPLVEALIKNCAEILLDKEVILRDEALQIFDPINGLARENPKFRQVLWAS